MNIVANSELRIEWPIKRFSDIQEEHLRYFFSMVDNDSHQIKKHWTT